MNASVVGRGVGAPLGATVHPGGVNFSVFSRDATRVDLLLFDDETVAQPSRVFPLDPDRHRTYHYWHGFVSDLGPGQVYAFRAHGPFAPERGLRFDGEKVLLDSYGFAVAVPEKYSRHSAEALSVEQAAYVVRPRTVVVLALALRVPTEGDSRP